MQSLTIEDNTILKVMAIIGDFPFLCKPSTHLHFKIYHNTDHEKEALVTGFVTIETKQAVHPDCNNILNLTLTENASNLL